jgi:MYXO-CTERM domain-containing protein
MRLLALAAALLALASGRARAENDCRSVNIRFVPSEDLQIVAWIEDAAGNYIDTAFITQTTGLRGLGNRVGLMGLKTGPRWPYGSREDVLPIWAHRHRLSFPQIVWQMDSLQRCDLNTTYSDSSRELFYCRPMQPTEPAWDAGTCASAIFTDKGKFSTTQFSHYPPRADVIPGMHDSADARQFASLDVFDAVSRATPAADQPYEVMWVMPGDLPAGDYVLRVEASKEKDFNTTFTPNKYPSTECVWHEYGEPYRGQPSVVHDVPFTVGSTDTSASTDTYAGYSDLGGNVHAPDSTITADTPGSGASRLRVVSENGELYRVRVMTHPSGDADAPGAPSNPRILNVEATSASLTFVAPGDDDLSGTIARYDARILAAAELDENSFRGASPLPELTPVQPGDLQTIQLDALAPYTPYSVGIRAYDECGHASSLLVIRFETPTAELAACDCATSDPRGFGLIVATFAFMLRRRRKRQ